MFDRGPFRALATLLFAVTLPGTLIAQPTKQVGTIGGSFDVTLSGTSTYTIPIRLAPGAAGTEPKLARPTIVNPHPARLEQDGPLPAFRRLPAVRRLVSRTVSSRVWTCRIMMPCILMASV
jgi:hypothetical protein